MKNCVVCENNNFQAVGSKTHADITTRKTAFTFDVNLACCKKCGLVFQNPLQQESKLQAYYRDTFRSEDCVSDEAIAGEFRPAIDAVSKFLKKGHRLLEIGCANGVFLKNMQDKGALVLGIEPSDKYYKQAKDKGLDIFHGNYQDFNMGNGKFDIVCSYYTMEHLSSPVDFLYFCNRVLADKGILCLEVPDIGCYERLEGLNGLLFFFEHQYHFSKEVIKYLLSKCGFESLDFLENAVRPYGTLFLARKVSPPGHCRLQAPQGNFDRVMEKIAVYRKKQSQQEAAMRKIIYENSLTSRKKVVVFGAGNHARLVFELLQDVFKEIPVAYIVDSDIQKQGAFLNNIVIKSPREINSSVDAIVILSVEFEKEIYKYLTESLGVEGSKITTFTNAANIRNIGAAQTVR